MRRTRRSWLVGPALLASALAAGCGARPSRGAGRPQPLREGERPLAPTSGEGGSALSPAEPGSGAPSANDGAVIDAVSALPGLQGWTVIPLAHFERERRHVVVVWPAIDAASELVDATVVGVCLEQTAEGRFDEVGRRWVVREPAESRRAIEAALGGPDYRVVGRSAGVPLDVLGSRLSSLAEAFASAVRGRDREAARSAASSFSELLPIERVAHEPAVAELLWLAAARSGRLELGRTERRGGEAVLTLRLLRGGAALRTVTATARQVPGAPDLWVISSYEE